MNEELSPELEEIAEHDDALAEEIREEEGIDPEAAQAAEAEDKDPSGYTKAIHKKHFELMEERRANADLQKQLDDLKLQMPQNSRPAIPPVPNQYDDDFEVQIKARDDAIRDAASYDARQSYNADIESRTAAQAAAQQRQKASEIELAYSGRAKSAGITDSEMNTSIKTVAAYGGVGHDLAQYIMESDQGPSITAHLAQNPDVITKLQGMSAAQGAVYLSGNITPVAASVAPPPVDSLGGGGASLPSKGPAGATYE